MGASTMLTLIIESIDDETVSGEEQGKVLYQKVMPILCGHCFILAFAGYTDMSQAEEV